MTAQKIAIIGGGPAGLMAAQQLVGKGYELHLFDAMASLGRKFLMAGKSGMNLTHSEDFDRFLSRYGASRDFLENIITDFTPQDIRDWASTLGVETFVGSSGRVFPTDFKAAPLLRSWLRYLRARGLTIHTRHRWCGWDDSGALIFDTPHGQVTQGTDASIFAMGSVCWPKLGSDGHWQTAFDDQQIPRTVFKPSNCGFECDWSNFFRDKFAGHPVKAVALQVGTNKTKGEFVISQTGIEGSAIYPHSRALCDQIEENARARLSLDLCPDRSLENLKAALKRARGSQSLSNHIRKATGLKGVKSALLRECLDQETFTDMDRLAGAIKALPVPLLRPRPIEEAISCAGGVRLGQLSNDLMIKHKPGTFLAGEMLDWDAPTGGYLLTACFALGKRAGQGVDHWLTGESPDAIP